MIQFNHTRDDNTGVVWVMQRRFIINSLSAISTQEVKRVICPPGVMGVWELEVISNAYNMVGQVVLYE